MLCGYGSGPLLSHEPIVRGTIPRTFTGIELDVLCLFIGTNMVIIIGPVLVVVAAAPPAVNKRAVSGSRPGTAAGN